ncbi:MAG: restriction endonuclease subunit S [Gemmatimonadota bacterium]|nr:restriction endonuclease subunit S [Gemmatimonadota bacterium]
MGEIFAHPRLKNVEMERVPIDQSDRSRFLLQGGDLLFARQSLVLAGAGKCSIFLGDNEPATFESHIIRVRLNQAKANPLYYYYYFQSHEGRAAIQSIVEQGAGASGIRATDLAAIDVAWCPITVQDAIAHILGTLDDKIELNQRMNETLEEMARALFKSWFVDFDPVRAKMEGRDTGLPPDVDALFPDRLVESELGEIPEGWEIGCFGSIVSPIKNRVGEREAVVLSAISSGELVKSGEYFTKQVYSKSIANYLTVEQWDIAYNPSRINIGSVGMLKDPFLGAVSPVYVVIRPQPAYRWYLEFTLQLYQVKEWISTLASGSVRQALPCQDFMSIPCVIPPHLITQRFDKEWEHLHRISMVRANESRILSSMRDTLLPRLISGEVRVKNADTSLRRMP